MPAFTFKTETGSVYDVDPEQQLIRRHKGPESFDLSHPDDTWLHYEDLMPGVFPGQPVYVVWWTGSDPDDESILVVRTTMTSAVTEVE